MSQTTALKQPSTETVRGSQEDLSSMAEEVAALAPAGSDQAGAIRRFFTAGLQRYLERLDDIARRHVGQAVGNPALIREFEDALETVLTAGELVADQLEPTVAKQLKAAFRRGIRSRVTGSPLVERGLAKPRGYPGDYLMMDIRYDDRVELGDGLRGLFDRYAFDHYRLIKERSETIKRIITSHLLDPARSGKPWRVCSMGSGPAREWVDLGQQLVARASSEPALPRVELTCLDRDTEALAYAKARLEGNPVLSSAEYAASDLLKFAEADSWSRYAGRYDLVYSLGVANYFYDTTLAIIIDTGFRLLQPGGSLIITHKALETFNFLFADWVCDWTFVKRSVTDFTRSFQEALAQFRGQFEWRMEWKPDEEMFGIAKRLV